MSQKNLLPAVRSSVDSNVRRHSAIDVCLPIEQAFLLPSCLPGPRCLPGCLPRPAWQPGCLAAWLPSCLAAWPPG